MTIGDRCRTARNVVGMRAEPDGDSEQVSQLLLNEAAAVEAHEGEWCRVVGPDGYRGWVRANALSPAIDYPGLPVVVTALLAPIVPTSVPSGPRITLASFGTVLVGTGPAVEGFLTVWLPTGETALISGADVEPLAPRPPATGRSLAAVALHLLGIPYLWGGRSAFGYDCSGYTQTIYGVHGVVLPRDADLQANWNGLTNVPLGSVEAGDLLFFGGGSDRHSRRITHVGICVGGGRFAHAAGGGQGSIVSALDDPAYRGRLVSAGRLEADPQVCVD